MRYTVIEKQSLADLTELVNEALVNGWRPLGGVAASVVQTRDRYEDWTNEVWYAQAMTSDQL